MNRNSELAKIHIAKKELGIDDDTYRDMLWTIARVRSAKDLDEKSRRDVLEHLKSRGFKSKTNGRPSNIQSLQHGPMLQKIEALLAEKGRPWSYADGIAERMFGIKKLQLCGADQLHKIIAALSIDAERHPGGAA